MNNYQAHAEKIEREMQTIEKEIAATTMVANLDEIKEITPAQYFDSDAAYVAIPITELIDKKVKTVVYMISSERKKIELTDNDLLSLGLHTKRCPLPPERWSKVSITNYLNGQTEAELRKTFYGLKKLYGHYIDFSDERLCSYMACWVIGTYFHRLFESFPYIHLNGTMESGKSKTLSLTSLVAFNGEMTFNSTPSYVVRTIHDNHATCCIDEVESLAHSKDDNSRLVIGMFNAGYKKGSFVGKAEQVGNDKKWKPTKFEAYSPKMFAGINGLEGSLASRCIPIVMTRSTNKTIKNREVRNSSPIFQTLRDHLYVVMLECHGIIQEIYESIRDEEIVGREWELWKPVLTIAQAIEPNLALYNELRAFALEVQLNKKETVLDGLVTPKLLIQLEVFMLANLQGDGFFSAHEITEHLVEYDSESFGWLKEAKNPGRWLGDELRKAGVVKGRAVQQKVEGKNTKGYHLDIDVVRERMKAFE